MQLVRLEIQQAAGHAGVGAGLMSVAGMLALLGAAALVTAAIAVLSQVLPVWASSLIVAALLFGAAGVAGFIARREARRVQSPHDRLASVAVDVRAVTVPLRGDA